MIVKSLIVNLICLCASMYNVTMPLLRRYLYAPERRGTGIIAV